MLRSPNRFVLVLLIVLVFAGIERTRKRTKNENDGRCDKQVGLCARIVSRSGDNPVALRSQTATRMSPLRRTICAAATFGVGNFRARLVARNGQVHSRWGRYSVARFGLRERRRPRRRAERRPAGLCALARVGRRGRRPSNASGLP